MPSAILTDGATFTCSHQGKGTVELGLSISKLAENVTIGGHKPILAGATISGPFTCPFQTPCTSFTLPGIPSEQTLTIGGELVFTMADAPAIALVPENTSGIPGLTIIETQTLVSA